MAYRPPSQSRFAAATAAPPPGPFSSRSSRPAPIQDSEGWITPSSRRSKYGESGFTESVSVPGKPVKTLPNKNSEDDFPTLGSAPSLPKKTWGSSESMAERMRKKIQEEEEDRTKKEQEKLLKEKEKESSHYNNFVPTTFISHTNLMRGFKDDEKDMYDEEDVYCEPGLNDDGYGYNYDYAERVESYTPDYSYDNGSCEYKHEDNEWDNEI